MTADNRYIHVSTPLYMHH